MTAVNRVRAVFSDNEGCIIPGKGAAFPLEALAQVRSFLSGVPALPFAICTGRSVAYTEAMVQVLDLLGCQLPCVCEGGAVLYWPGTDRYELIATLSGTQLLLEALPDGSYRIEPGKSACLSLYPNAPATVRELYDRLMALPLAAQYEITVSAAAVDITPLGVDKATGVLAASDRVSVALSEVLCIGDAHNDIPMLRAAGHSACPLNADPAVKAVVDFVATRESTLGLLEILRRYEPMFPSDDSHPEPDFPESSAATASYKA